MKGGGGGGTFDVSVHLICHTPANKNRLHDVLVRKQLGTSLCYQLIFGNNNYTNTLIATIVLAPYLVVIFTSCFFIPFTILIMFLI